MARRRGGFKRASRRRGGMGGMTGYLKPALFGLAAGLITPKIPILNTMPYGNFAAGAAAGYFAKRTIMGAAVGSAAGGIVAPPVGNAINSATGMRLY